jgi:nucleoside phosphorylase
MTEGTGPYGACQDQNADWILVKAICDWADGKKDQDKAARQQTAAQNAARYVLLPGIRYLPRSGY